MKTRKKRQMVKLQGSGTIGHLLSQYLISDKSSREDIKIIEGLTGQTFQAPGKRNRKYKI